MDISLLYNLTNGYATHKRKKETDMPYRTARTLKFLCHPNYDEIIACGTHEKKEEKNRIHDSLKRLTQQQIQASNVLKVRIQLQSKRRTKLHHNIIVAKIFVQRDGEGVERSLFDFELQPASLIELLCKTVMLLSLPKETYKLLLSSVVAGYVKMTRLLVSYNNLFPFNRNQSKFISCKGHPNL